MPHWALIEQDPTIELVLSDVVTPGGMSGLELGRTLRKQRPGLPVVLATGCTQWGSRVMDEDFTLIAKPYHREALAAAIRAALERGNARRPIAAVKTERTVGT